MNYILRQIVVICDDSPTLHEHGSLADFQRRLNAYDRGMARILMLAHKLQEVLDGGQHMHVAGTLEDLHIDTCAICGRDIREDVHRGAQ